MSNAAMNSILQYGPSFSPEAKALLRAVFKDFTTPLAALECVLNEWHILDSKMSTMTPERALAPLLVWSCIRPAHTKIAYLHVFGKWSEQINSRTSREQAVATTSLFKSLAQCLEKMDTLVSLKPSHHEAFSSCVAYGLGTELSKLEVIQPGQCSDSVNDDLHNAKTELLFALIYLVHVPALSLWSHEDLHDSVDTAARKTWPNIPNHLVAANAHQVLDSNIASAAKLSICHQLPSWTWTTHELSKKIAQLLPSDPYKRALALPWGGKPYPIAKNQALVGVRINRQLAAHYLPELHGMMLLTDSTIGAWRCKKNVLQLLQLFAPKKEPAMELALPTDIEMAP